MQSCWLNNCSFSLILSQNYKQNVCSIWVYQAMELDYIKIDLWCAKNYRDLLSRKKNTHTIFLTAFLTDTNINSAIILKQYQKLRNTVVKVNIVSDRKQAHLNTELFSPWHTIMSLVLVTFPPIVIAQPNWNMLGQTVV